MTDRTPSAARRLTRPLLASLPYVLAAGLFVFGLAALYRLLDPVDLDAVVAQLRAMPWATVAAALMTTICAYLALVGYDWSALRYIGKPLPLPVVMTGGLMAYAFGNTIGLSAISGGAVRWRLYSGLGLDGYDVAAVSTFAAVAFGLAATVVGLAALAAHPAALVAVVPFPPATVQIAAILGIAGIVLPLVWASIGQHELRLGRFRLRAPSLGILAGQILFSLGDLCFTALTLWLLLPVSDMSFFSFLAVFAAASVAGIISHVPGGVGIFETVIIAAMPRGAPVDQIAAALLMYRLIYYLLPFVLALTVLAGYELWRGFDHKRPAGVLGRSLALVEPAFSAVAPLAPLLLGVMIFGSGLWMSIAPLIPRTGPAAEAAEAAETFLPLAFAEGSALLSSAIGAVLIVLALGVVRRSFGAYVMAAAAMGAGIVVAIADDGDYRRAAGLALALAILLPFRRAFFRRAILTHAALAPGWVILVLSSVTAFGFVLFLSWKSVPFSHEMWWQFAADERAPRALRAGFVASLIVVALAVWLLLRAPRLRLAPPDDRQMASIAHILRDQTDPGASYALMGDKVVILSQGADAFVMFGAADRSWIARGGPFGDPAAAREAGWLFVEAARQQGARPVFYAVGPADQGLMMELGMSMHRIGNEAIMDLSRFSLEDGERRAMRDRHEQARRDGLTIEISMPPHDPALIGQLQVISTAWLAGRRSGARGFSVGRADPAWLGRWPLAIVRKNDQPVAFASLLTTGRREWAAIDLVRNSAEGGQEALHFLMTGLALHLQAEGWQSLSLGMSPLAGLDPDRSRRLWDRFGALIFPLGENFATSAELRSFLQEFATDWMPRYLAVPTSLPPVRPLADVARLMAGAPIARRRGLSRQPATSAAIDG